MKAMKLVLAVVLFVALALKLTECHEPPSLMERLMECEKSLQRTENLLNAIARIVKDNSRQHRRARLRKQQRALKKDRMQKRKLQLQKSQIGQAARDLVSLQQEQTEARPKQATLEEAAHLPAHTEETDAATKAIYAHQESATDILQKECEADISKGEDIEAEDAPAEVCPLENYGDSELRTWLVYISLYCAVTIALTVARGSVKCRMRHH